MYLIAVLQLIANDLLVIARVVVNAYAQLIMDNLLVTDFQLQKSFLTWPLLPIVCQAIRLPATGATFKPSLRKNIYDDDM